MKELISCFAEMILNKYFSYKSKSGMNLFPEINGKKLMSLYPGKPVKQLVKEYYKDKISKIILATIFIIAIVIAVSISRLTSNTVTKENSLPRNDVGNGKYSVNLSASTDDYRYGEIEVKVEERLLSDAECDSMMDELYNHLTEIVPGENEGFNHIEKDMVFPAKVDNYPFSLRWESSDYLIVDSNGHINNEDINEEGVPIDIKVIMSYRKREKTYDIKAIIYPVTLSEDEKRISELKDALLSEDEKSKTKSQYKLPDFINGKPISWKETKQPVVPIVIILGVCLIIGIWFGTDKDLTSKYEERNRQMIIEYAEFVSKLQILLSSGSTIRKAMEKIAEDYKRNRQKGGEYKYVYEELLLCIRKLRDGVDEAGCYEFFGNRCGIVCYKKLTSLLIQNLRKGTEGILEAMDNEVRMAFEERKAVARRMGEEAQTKMIFPMMLMLSVVMLIIMIPAYLSFGGL